VRLTRRELILSAAALPVLAAKKPAVRPNVVLIVLEDVGAWMLGCYGNREIRTPNIDVLARSGMRFVSSYAASAVPLPGLATILTGQSPRQLGFAAGEAPPASLEQAPMISDVLAGAGYLCGFAGEWKLTQDKPQHGFKFWDTTPDYSAVAAKASQFLDGQKAGQPFLLVAAYSFPDAVPSRYVDAYASTTFDTIGWVPKSPNAAAHKDALKDIPASIRKAAAAMTALDDQVALLIKKLDQGGLRDDTLIVLTSASGALLGRHGLWGDGRASDPPNMYEEVVAVPLAWDWQGRTPADSTRTEFVGAYDLLPSLCELANAPLPAGRKLPGRSYLPAVFNRPFPKKQPWRNVVFAEFDSAAMVRDDRYKMVLRSDGKPTALYDEVADQRENVNQYEDPRFVTSRDDLTRDLTAWTKSF
jgi:arylsulfatase A-like enzyme